MLSENGIESIQGLSYQYIPNPGGNYKRKYHYTGQINKWGQRYLVRNVFFEPSLLPQIDWVNKCLQEIEIAFRMKKAAIIGSHRVNFIGSIVPENSSVNLRLFENLLIQILKKWPDVQFITSGELTDILNKKEYHD
ncbi:MAG: hypothetical protein IPN10_02550 [Saprospiraceae bacterium]|nr:hypothetical protein [Saprospiraceae bacterium]